MFDAVSLMTLQWLFGGDGAEAAPKAPPAELPPQAQGGLWPRTAPSGDQVPTQHTGGTDPAEWRRDRFARAKAFLESDQSLDVLTHLVETGAVERGDFAIDDIALAVVTHWDIETASGQHEYNGNVGNITALPGQQYFSARDEGAGKEVAFVAYDTFDQAVADYFGVISLPRYRDALIPLLMTPELPDWFSELGWAGYYAMDPTGESGITATEAEQAWIARRADVALDLGMTIDTGAESAGDQGAAWSPAEQAPQDEPTAEETSYDSSEEPPPEDEAQPEETADQGDEEPPPEDEAPPEASA
jgi:hypothetical protein